MRHVAPVRRGWLAVCAAWGALAASAGPQSATQQPAADRAPPKQEERRERLKLDIDKHVERLLAGRPDLPRFEDSVEVRGKAPQVMLERFFGGVDLECGPSTSAAPSEGEMRAYRPHPAPYMDFAALAAALARKFGPKGAPRYFLYRIERQDGVSYSLREDRIPQSWFVNLPGTSYELLESFANLDDAVTAWRRVHRGEKQLLPPAGGRLAPWVTANCRPK